MQVREATCLANLMKIYFGKTTKYIYIYKYVVTTTNRIMNVTKLGKRFSKQLQSGIMQ